MTSPTVEAESGGTTIFGTLVSDLQTDVEVADGAITGTLYLQTEGVLPTDWGEGYFMALKFSDIDPKAQSVKVGLTPSEGSGLVELDEDMNGVFKVTDKDEQKFTVVSSYGTTVKTDYYDLSDLVLDETVG